MIQWLHHLFNPHCPDCNVCKSCEVLRTQLEIANITNKQLLDVLIKPAGSPQQIIPENIEPIKPRYTPWRVQREILEREDRERAKLLKLKNEELEKELGIVQTETEAALE